jgi:hypothetical protein
MGKKQERSTRDWISTLRLQNGNPMQCDVENGGQDKRAYILVPTTSIEQVKTALTQYRNQLQQAGAQHSPNYRYTNNDSSAEAGYNHTRPTEIYVPTAAVLKNLQRMKNLSSSEIWKAAPLTVRNSTRLQKSSVSGHTNAAPNQQNSPSQWTDHKDQGNIRISPDQGLHHDRPTPIKRNTSNGSAQQNTYRRISTPKVHRPKTFLGHHSWYNPNAHHNHTNG